MKNKAVSYFLIGGVVFIWGIIFYRIYSSVSGGSDDNAISFAKPDTASLTDISDKDTFELIAAYRDPFLGGLARPVSEHYVPKSETAKAKLKPVLAKEPDIPVDWSFIRYMGSIRNPKTLKVVALVSINNAATMLAEGETVDGVQLITNYRDSIKVSFNKKVSFIGKNK